MMKSLVIPLLLVPAPAFSDPAAVEAVDAGMSADRWTFSVTLRHGDTGWDDYADGWRVVGPDGTILGTRELAHPHVNEQPFTRSLSGVALPPDLTEVGIEASTSTGGWSGQIVRFTLPDR